MAEEELRAYLEKTLPDGKALLEREVKRASDKWKTMQKKLPAEERGKVKEPAVLDAGRGTYRDEKGAEIQLGTTSIDEMLERAQRKLR